MNNKKNNITNNKMNKSGKINKTTIILGVVALVVIAVFGFISATALSDGDKTTGTGKNTLNPLSGTTNNNGEFQTATLQYKNYEYELTPNTLKKGVPVKITVDTNTVVGCMRDIVISDFGVRKRVTSTDNIIEFTPDKDGTFWIVCSMNMGRGTFSVSSDGTAPAGSLSAPTAKVASSTSPAPAGTCGMTTGASGGAKTGGCGCGMR